MSEPSPQWVAAFTRCIEERYPHLCRMHDEFTRKHGLEHVERYCRRITIGGAEDRAAFAAVDWCLRTWLPMFIEATVRNDDEGRELHCVARTLEFFDYVGAYRDLMQIVGEVNYLEQMMGFLPPHTARSDAAWQLVQRTGEQAVEKAVEDAIACPFMDEVFNVVYGLTEDLANRAIAGGKTNFDGFMVKTQRSAIELLGHMKETIEAPAEEKGE